MNAKTIAAAGLIAALGASSGIAWASGNVNSG